MRWDPGNRCRDYCAMANIEIRIEIGRDIGLSIVWISKVFGQVEALLQWLKR